MVARGMMTSCTAFWMSSALTASRPCSTHLFHHHSTWFVTYAGTACLQSQPVQPCIENAVCGNTRVQRGGRLGDARGKELRTVALAAAARGLCHQPLHLLLRDRHALQVLPRKQHLRMALNHIDVWLRKPYFSTCIINSVNNGNKNATTKTAFQVADIPGRSKPLFLVMTNIIDLAS